MHTLGDAHIYKDHADVLEEQIKRIPHPFPILQIKRKVDNIEDYSINDFNLMHYTPHSKIKMKMAV